MKIKKPDIKPDISEAGKESEDRGESHGLMEPLLISEGGKASTELTDLAVELAQCNAGFRKSLPDGVMSRTGLRYTV
jgi:hypothetical protein